MKSLVSCFVVCLTFGAIAMAETPRTTDAHLHLLDFLQNGDYLENGKLVEKKPGQALPAGERYKLIDAALWAMDNANVSHALISGMPFVKNGMRMSRLGRVLPRQQLSSGPRPRYRLPCGARTLRLSAEIWEESSQKASTDYSLVSQVLMVRTWARSI